MPPNALALSVGILTTALGAWSGLSIAAGGEDTATLKITGEGPQVHVDLRAPAVGLVGFAHAPQTADERETLALAVENLKTGNGLVRFNAQAECRLEKADIDSDPAPKGRAQGELGASYLFHCDQPTRLGSAALGIFLGFPALSRAHVHYSVAGAAGEAILTPINPVVSFIPLR